MSLFARAAYRRAVDFAAMTPRIALAGPERLDELGPLWLQLHHHHARVSRVQPFVDDETSWAARRRSYVETFEHGGFALVAEDGDDLVGYAMVRIHEGPDDSWALEDRYGEVWTVVVAESARGRGVGSALLDAVDAELAEPRDPRPDDRRDGGQRRRPAPVRAPRARAGLAAAATASRRPRDEGHAVRHPGVAPGVRGRADAPAQGDRLQAHRPAAVVPPGDPARAALPGQDGAGARARRAPDPDARRRSRARSTSCGPTRRSFPPTRPACAGRGRRDVGRRHAAAGRAPARVVGAAARPRGGRQLPRGRAPPDPGRARQAGRAADHPDPRPRQRVHRRRRSGPTSPPCRRCSTRSTAGSRTA